MSRQEDECNAKEKINNFSLIQSYIHADNNFAVRLRRFLFRHMHETSFRNPGYSKRSIFKNNLFQTEQGVRSLITAPVSNFGEIFHNFTVIQ